MKNVKAEVKGNILHIEVDLTKTFGYSTSGKTIIIGTSEGIQPIEGLPEKISYGLNVFKKPV